MSLKRWMLSGMNRVFTRADLPSRDAGSHAGDDARSEPVLRPPPPRAGRVEHLGRYGPLIAAIRTELEQFVASQLRLHLAIAERDRYLLTSIEVESTGAEEARDLLLRFTREFTPEQIRHFVAKEIVARYTTGGDLQDRQKQFSRDLGLARLHAWRATRARTGRAPDYAYYFERAIPWPAQPKYQAFHSAELPYMFDNLSSSVPWTDVDRRLADAMSSYWVNFARSGDPNGPGLPVWPAYRDAAKGEVQVLGDTITTERLPGPTQATLAFFDDAYQQLLKGGANQ